MYPALLTIDLHYSSDDGATWSPIALGKANTSRYLWKFYGLPTGDYLLRVTATDTNGISGFDLSDSSFYITDQVYITDLTGKIWDITHAVENYGMIPEYWQYGLGPYAFRPINDPEFLLPGDEGYPSVDDTFQVIGASFHGDDARAYPIPIIENHEVVNDGAGPISFAVVY